MNQLWEWTRVDPDGKSRTYQMECVDAPEDSIAAHLQQHYPHAKITGLKRIAPGARKDATGLVESHLFEWGFFKAFLKEQGLLPPDRSNLPAPIRRKPIVSY